MQLLTPDAARSAEALLVIGLLLLLLGVLEGAVGTDDEHRRRRP